MVTKCNDTFRTSFIHLFIYLKKSYFFPVSYFNLKCSVLCSLVLKDVVSTAPFFRICDVMRSGDTSCKFVHDKVICVPQLGTNDGFLAHFTDVRNDHKPKCEKH